MECGTYLLVFAIRSVSVGVLETTSRNVSFTVVNVVDGRSEAIAVRTSEGIASIYIFIYIFI